MKKDIFSGLGLGLLVGTIIGLSIAEVTGLILGALTSILGAFFGLRATKDGERPNQVIIGTFSITCVFSILLGLYIRTHDMLSTSLENQVKEYRIASFDTTEIKKIILLKNFGLIPEGYTFSNEAKRAERQTLLMAGDKGEIYLCSAINENSNLGDIKSAYRNSGAVYAQVEQKLSAAILDEKELRSTLIFFKNILCQEK